uniref:Uncharacterized protein n=1 Tax=Megaselia scalaris TaxID=36166 RepID=T1H329_MEGSC
MEISISQSDKVKLALKYCVHKMKFTRVLGSDKVVLKTKTGPIMGIQRKTMYGDYYYMPIEPWTKIRNCTKPSRKPLQKHIFMDM